MPRPAVPRPPSVAWRRALAAASRLGSVARDRAHSDLVYAVRGTEGRVAFDALIGSILRAWSDGHPRALPKVVALMAIDHGAQWREIDTLSNPLFVADLRG